VTRKPHVRMTPDRLDRLRALHAAGYSDCAIGRFLGVTQPAVSRHRRRLGLPCRFRRHRWSPADDATVRTAPDGATAARLVACTLAAAQVRRKLLGVAVAGGRHLAALRRAGWPWPVPGVPAFVSPMRFRTLLLLLAGPATESDLAAALGKGADRRVRTTARGRAECGLTALRAAGLVARFFPRAAGGGRANVRPTYLITAAGLDLIQSAAVAVGGAP
jgi:DNA-binding transcriptional ArsR family regulator